MELPGTGASSGCPLARPWGSSQHGVACWGLYPSTGIRQPGSGMRVRMRPLLGLRRTAGSACPAGGVSRATRECPLRGERAGRMWPADVRCVPGGKGTDALPRRRSCPGQLQWLQPMRDGCWLWALAVARQGSLPPWVCRSSPGGCLSTAKTRNNDSYFPFLGLFFSLFAWKARRLDTAVAFTLFVWPA